MSAKTASLENRIRQCWGVLSSHEQRLAEVILAAPGQSAMNTATELAQSAGVSKATTTRYFRHLGYDSYETARRQARDMQLRILTEGFPRDKGKGSWVPAGVDKKYC